VRGRRGELAASALWVHGQRGGRRGHTAWRAGGRRGHGKQPACTWRERSKLV